MSDSLSHDLSRLALAKAIKTPYEDDINNEHWSKSIIFCQPFVEEMETKAQKSFMKHSHHKDKKPTSKQQQQQQHVKAQQQQQQNNQLHQKQPKRHHQQQPKNLHNPSSKPHMSKSRSHLPSDSDDSEISDKRPSPRPKSYPTDNLPRPTSHGDGKKSMNHSRASSSSSATPLTEDDQAPEDHFRKPSLKHIPNEDYNRRSMKEMDLYYQQLYQQQQLQYQLALHQQQMYYQPIYLAAPRMEENKRHSSRHHRPTNTDLRRRAEMLRSSGDPSRHNHFI